MTSKRGLPFEEMEVVSCLMDLYTRSVSPVMEREGVDCVCSEALRTLSTYEMLPRPLIWILEMSCNKLLALSPQR